MEVLFGSKSTPSLQVPHKISGSIGARSVVNSLNGNRYSRRITARGLAKDTSKNNLYRYTV